MKYIFSLEVERTLFDSNVASDKWMAVGYLRVFINTKLCLIYNIGEQFSNYHSGDSML